MSEQRLARLRSCMNQDSLEALAVVPGPNLLYLANLSFHLSERPIVAIFPQQGTPALVLPAFEQGKVAGAPYAFDVFGYDDAEGPAPAFARAEQHLGLPGQRIGVEGRRIRHLELGLLSFGARARAADPVFAELRMRKDADEIAAMRRAVQIAETAFRETIPTLHAGLTERDIAAQLTIQLYRAGSEPELPFHPFAAAGTNGANPHASPEDRPVAPGDLITMDWGASWNHYFSDITRTVAVSGAPVHDDLRRAHEVVRAANAAGRQIAAPGATGQEVDRATRRVIEAAGLGQYFTHRTGHGLGLEGHEEPDMNEGSLVPLAPGMTFTVEPGVYIPGLGGVRIEDDVVITDSGCESLTTLERDLIIVG